MHQSAGTKRLTVSPEALDAAVSRGTGYGLVPLLTELGGPLRNRPGAAASLAASRAELVALAEASPLFLAGDWYRQWLGDLRQDGTLTRRATQGDAGLVAVGAALRRATRRSEARDPHRRAFDQAGRGGMLLLARRAREELNALGARPLRIALSGPGALTPGEYRVAHLAAQGLGNRAIAERLYVTQRTVETHLTHAFQKLDIRSRADLAAALEPQAEQAEPALAP